MAIKNIEKIEQPREKLAKYGVGKLSDEELLAIVLRTGPRGTHVLNFAKQILRQFKQRQLSEISIKELMAVKGLGQAKASEIVACFELGRRMLQGKQSAVVLSPRQVWEEFRDLRDSKKEHFVAFFLDTQNQVLKREVVSIGTLNASLIHPREVFEPAIKHLAAHVIIAHNHPSGSLEPSEQDIAVTARLVQAGKLLGVEVLDHVIVTSKGYMSFKSKNLL